MKAKVEPLPIALLARMVPSCSSIMRLAMASPSPVLRSSAVDQVLARQRKRWQRGALETFFKHRVMLFNPRYGPLSMLGFGKLLVEDVLVPPLELIGYLLIPIFYVTGILSLDYLLAFVGLVFAFGVFLSVGSLILEEMAYRRYPNVRDLSILLIAAIAENFGYR